MRKELEKQLREGGSIVFSEFNPVTLATFAKEKMFLDVVNYERFSCLGWEVTAGLKTLFVFHDVETDVQLNKVVKYFSVINRPFIVTTNLPMDSCTAAYQAAKSTSSIVMGKADVEAKWINPVASSTPTSSLEKKTDDSFPALEQSILHRRSLIILSCSQDTGKSQRILELKELAEYAGWYVIEVVASVDGLFGNISGIRKVSRGKCDLVGCGHSHSWDVDTLTNQLIEEGVRYFEVSALSDVKVGSVFHELQEFKKMDIKLKQMAQALSKTSTSTFGKVVQLTTASETKDFEKQSEKEPILRKETLERLKQSNREHLESNWSSYSSSISASQAVWVPGDRNSNVSNVSSVSSLSSGEVKPVAPAQPENAIEALRTISHGKGLDLHGSGYFCHYLNHNWHKIND